MTVEIKKQAHLFRSKGYLQEALELEQLATKFESRGVPDVWTKNLLPSDDLVYKELSKIEPNDASLREIQYRILAVMQKFPKLLGKGEAYSLEFAQYFYEELGREVPDSVYLWNLLIPNKNQLYPSYTQVSKQLVKMLASTQPKLRSFYNRSINKIGNKWTGNHYLTVGDLRRLPFDSKEKYRFGVGQETINFLLVEFGIAENPNNTNMVNEE